MKISFIPIKIYNFTPLLDIFTSQNDRQTKTADFKLGPKSTEHFLHRTTRKVRKRTSISKPAHYQFLEFLVGTYLRKKYTSIIFYQSTTFILKIKKKKNKHLLRSLV